MTYVVDLDLIHKQETGHKFAKWKCVQADSRLHQEFRKKYPDVWMEDADTFNKAMDEFVESLHLRIIKEEPYVEINDGWYQTKVRYFVEYGGF